MAGEYIDPAMLQYLMEAEAAGADPWLDQTDTYNPYVLPIASDSKQGTLDEQGSRLTQLNKANNMMLNPGFVLSLGAGAGGASREAFNPVTTYQPVKVAGRTKLNQWRDDGDPVHSFVYDAVVNRGWSEQQVQSAIRKVIADPNHPDHQAFMEAIPPEIVTDQVTGATTASKNPDLKYVTSDVNSLYSALANDDPWDGQTVDPTTGQPAMALQEDSPLMKSLKEAGFSATPYDTYDPYGFAPQGVTPESDAAAQTHAQKMNNVVRSTGEVARSQNERMTEMLLGKYDRGATPAGPAAPSVAAQSQTPDVMQQTPQRGGWADDLDRATRDPLGAIGNVLGKLSPSSLDRNIGDPIESLFNRGGGDQVDQPAQRQGVTRSRGPGPQSKPTGLDPAVRKRMEAEFAKANRAHMKAAGTGIVARNEAAQARFGQQQRQAMVEQLLAAGHSPFADQMRARQQQAWGV
jgi:hypothetical protein